MRKRSKFLGLIGSLVGFGAYGSRPVDAGGQSQAFVRR
jgi:hypothetical protein